MLRPTTLALALSCGLATAVHAQMGNGTKVGHCSIGANLDSGTLAAAAGRPGAQLVFSTELSSGVEGQGWVRLVFGPTLLGGDTETERCATLVITSLADGAQQRLNADDLRAWSNTSAYFNGGRVRLEVFTWPGAPARVMVDAILVPGPGEGGGAGGDSLCGPDDRTLSSDARAGRLLPGAGGAGCTAFLIADQGRCMLTAGSCAPGAGSVVEFNVPLSSSGGGIQHPPPSSQYPVDPASVQVQSSGSGANWAYFGVHANTVTRMAAGAAQGSAFSLAAAPGPSGGSMVRLVGYGGVSVPVSLTWNQVQKLGLGSYISLAGGTMGHRANATAGDEGAPVQLVGGSGAAIGVNAGDGCVSGNPGSMNTATAMQVAALQAALSNPQGVCSRPSGGVMPPVYLVGEAGGELLTLQRSTGMPGAVAPVGAPGAFAGLAYDRMRGRFYGSRFNPAGPDDLFAIDPVTGQASLIGAIAGAVDISGLGFDPNTDTLYGIDQGDGRLYRISLTTGAATPAGAGLNPGTGGIDYDPVTATLYGVQDGAQGTRLIRIDTGSGQGTVIGQLGAGITDCDGLACCIQDRFLYTVNQASGQMLRVDPGTGAASPVGATGVALNAGFGMACAEDCAPPCVPNSPIPSPGQFEVWVSASLYWYGCPNQKMYAVDTNPNLLYDILTGTGQSTVIGPVTPGSTQITGLTWDGTRLVAIDLANGRLLWINRQTGAPTTLGNTGITGWQDLACDHTNLDQLYGITQSNNLYRISPTGTATLVAPNVGNLVTAMAFDISGQLWGIEYLSGRVLRINKQTGSVTHVTTTIAGMQGVGFDDAGVLYAVNSSTDSVYTVNLQTGAATLRGSTGTEFLTCMTFGMTTFAGVGPGGGGEGGGDDGAREGSRPGAEAPHDAENLTRRLIPVVDPSKIMGAGLPRGYEAVAGDLRPARGGVVPIGGAGIGDGRGGMDSGCGGTAVNFDEAAAPCSFGQTTRATNQYADRGAILEGPGGNDGPAILNQCAGFGVTGISGPNVLAFNSASVLSDGGVPRGPLTIRFTSPVSSVSAIVGSGWSTGIVTMQPYRGATALAPRSVPLSPAMTQISVADTGITRVVISSTAPAWVMDDLCFVQSCPTLYDVYFGTTNPPPLVATGLPNTFFRQTYMDSTTLYYWRVVAKNCCGPVWSFTTTCYPNCDGSTAPPVLNVLDFVCFLNRFAAGDTWANCDGSTTAPVLNVLDFVCFTNRFAFGCPG
jgi:sugar lactone lactonase YvrE